MKQFCVYILSNHSRTLYIGVTNNLIRRIYEHRHKLVPGFTSKYNIHQLAYYELHSTATSAIEREKQLKGWKRDKKIALIEASNPHWEDLSSTLKERMEAPVIVDAVAKTTLMDDPGQILRCAQDDGLAPSSQVSAGALSGLPNNRLAPSFKDGIMGPNTRDERPSPSVGI
jgi:putative endonuclease